MTRTIVWTVVLLVGTLGRAAEPVPIRVTVPEAEYQAARKLLDRARDETMKLKPSAVKTVLLTTVATSYADLGAAEQGVEAIRVAEGTVVPVVGKHRDETDLADYLYDQVALAHTALGRAADAQRVQRKIQYRETRIFNAAYGLQAYAMAQRRDLYDKHVGAVGFAAALVDAEIRGDVLAPLASSHAWMGRMDLAEQVRVGATVPAGQISVRAAVADALLLRGQVDLARKWIQPAGPLVAKISDEDLRGASRSEIATVLAELGDIAGAEAQLAGIQEPVEKAGVLAYLAAAYARSGDRAKAQQLLGAAEKGWAKGRNDDADDFFAPIDNHWMWADLGYAYAAGGMLNEAVARAAKMKPGVEAAFFCQGVASYYGMVRLGSQAAKRLKATP